MTQSKSAGDGCFAAPLGEEGGARRSVRAEVLNNSREGAQGNACYPLLLASL
jgi:hypothetical protein